MEIVMKIVLVLWLVLLSRQDIRRKEVSAGLLLFGTVIALCSVGMTVGDWHEGSILFSKGTGLAFGIVLMLFSKASGGQMGMGDAIVFTVTGVVFGFWNNLILLFYSLVCSAVYSAVLLIRKKIEKKESIAFLPFVVLGTLGVLLV